MLENMYDYIWVDDMKKNKIYKDIVDILRYSGWDDYGIIIINNKKKKKCGQERLIYECAVAFIEHFKAQTVEDSVLNVVNGKPSGLKKVTIDFYPSGARNPAWVLQVNYFCRQVVLDWFNNYTPKALVRCKYRNKDEDYFKKQKKKLVDYIACMIRIWEKKIPGHECNVLKMKF